MLKTSRHVRKDEKTIRRLHLRASPAAPRSSSYWLSAYMALMAFCQHPRLPKYHSAHPLWLQGRDCTQIHIPIARAPTTTSHPERRAFPPGRAVGLQRDQMWDVIRLIVIAATKESAATCPMARVPMDALVVLGGLIIDFLRVPSDMHLHPPATQACKICFTPICEVCEDVGLDCRCGTNNLRRLRGDPERALPCYFAFADRCFPCGGGACLGCTVDHT